MGIATQTADAHIGLLIVAGIVLAGVVGMITTHKGNKGRRTGGRARPRPRRRR